MVVQRRVGNRRGTARVRCGLSLARSLPGTTIPPSTRTRSRPARPTKCHLTSPLYRRIPRPGWLHRRTCTRYRNASITATTVQQSLDPGYVAASATGSFAAPRYVCRQVGPRRRSGDMSWCFASHTQTPGRAPAPVYASPLSPLLGRKGRGEGYLARTPLRPHTPRHAPARGGRAAAVVQLPRTGARRKSSSATPFRSSGRPSLLRAWNSTSRRPAPPPHPGASAKATSCCSAVQPVNPPV